MGMAMHPDHYGHMRSAQEAAMTGPPPVLQTLESITKLLIDAKELAEHLASVAGLQMTPEPCSPTDPVATKATLVSAAMNIESSLRSLNDRLGTIRRAIIG